MVQLELYRPNFDKHQGHKDRRVSKSRTLRCSERVMESAEAEGYGKLGSLRTSDEKQRRHYRPIGPPTVHKQQGCKGCGVSRSRSRRLRCSEDTKADDLQDDRTQGPWVRPKPTAGVLLRPYETMADKQRGPQGLRGRPKPKVAVQREHFLISLIDS